MRLALALFLLISSTSTIPGQSRLTAQDWAADLAYLGIKLEDRHANLYHTYHKSSFVHDLNEIQSLSSSVPEEELLIRLSELVARVGDAHTFLDFRNQKYWTFAVLPIQVNYFHDGLFVVGADSNYTHLIGAQITSINAHPIDKVIEQVRKIGYNENEFTQLISVSRFITYPAVLKRFGFVDPDRPIEIQFLTEDVTTTDHLTPVLPDSVNWKFAHDRKAQLPLTYQRNDSIFWLDHNPQDQLLYLQINRCIENERHRFTSLSDSIIEIVSKHQPTKLVLDLRRNIGGNSALTNPLIYALMHYEKTVPDGQLFIITGRWTLSAAVVLCSEIRKFCRPLFVGEPSGAAPNLFGENSYWLTLPRSELRISYSSAWFQPAGPFVHDPWIAPDIYIPIRSRDFFAAQEPVLNTIRQWKRHDVSNLAESINSALASSGIEEAVAKYEAYKSALENRYVNTMQQIRRMANRIGRNGQPQYALIFHELNVRDYPGSAHAALNLAQIVEDLRGYEEARPYYLQAQAKLASDGYLNAYLKHYFEDFINSKLD